MVIAFFKKEGGRKSHTAPQGAFLNDASRPEARAFTSPHGGWGGMAHQIKKSRSLWSGLFSLTGMYFVFYFERSVDNQKSVDVYKF